MNTIEYLRQFRLGSYAIFDFTASFVRMLLLAPLLSSLAMKLGLYIPKRNWVFFTIPLSILIHILTGNMTPLTKFVIDPSGHYIEKVFVLGLCILSILGIKKTSQRTSRF